MRHVLVILVALCVSIAGAVTASAENGAPPATVAAAAPPLGRTVLLGSRLRTAGCHRGVLPDRACSPGARYSGLTKTVLCSASFHTSSVRNVPDSVKHRVEIEYGMVPKAYGRTIEIDHIVSLELGGRTTSLTSIGRVPQASCGAVWKSSLRPVPWTTMSTVPRMTFIHSASDACSLPSRSKVARSG